MAEPEAGTEKRNRETEMKIRIGGRNSKAEPEAGIGKRNRKAGLETGKHSWKPESRTENQKAGLETRKKN